MKKVAHTQRWPNYVGLVVVAVIHLLLFEVMLVAYVVVVVVCCCLFLFLLSVELIRQHTHTTIYHSNEASNLIREFSNCLHCHVVPQL